MVRYTRRFPDKVWVFDHSQGRGEFICEAYAYEAKDPLQELTNEEGNIDPTIREQMKQRKRLKKRAKQATEDLYKINRDMAEPIGGLLITQQEKNEKDNISPIPEFELEQNWELKSYDSDLSDYSLEIELEHAKTESPVFEYAYERFEYIASKDQGDISEKDITFLKDFIQSESYTGLYETEYSEWVNELLRKKIKSTKKH